MSVHDNSILGNAMQGRREKTHTAPRFFSHLPCNPSTLFPFPLTVQAEERWRTTAAHEISSDFLANFPASVEGEKEKGGEGVGRGGEKLLGPDVVVPAPPDISIFLLSFSALGNSNGYVERFDMLGYSLVFAS
jgi:hypothetical protein